MAAADSSSEYETSGVSGSTESLDLSCIHWGYLNCTLVTDPKKIKDNVWQTYWVDLCGSTIRLYKDLSLPPNSASQLPPSSLIGPSNENEKKEAFIILKKGAEVAIVEPEIEPYKSRKRLRVNKRHAFKVTFANKGANCPAYVFQAPSKGSMYRWISKIEEGIDMADKPQNESATEKKLKEAKLLSMEQRRFQMAPKLRYLDKDDVDSGMEGDVEEAYEASQKSSEDVLLDDLRKRLQEKEQLVRQLDREERAFLGPENSTLVRRCEFQSTTNKDYYLIPGHPLTLLPRGSELTILGQLSNNRWRCVVELPRHASTEFTNGLNSETSSEVESASSFDISDDNNSDSKPETEMLIGSVPSSLLVELRLPSAAKIALKYDDGTPIASPEETPQLSPFPSPPPSPYSSHKSDRTSLQNRSSLRRSIASENLSEHDIWEQFCIPSPPSSPATSRTTSPSLSPSGSPAGSLEALDFDVDTSKESSAALKGNELLNYPQVKLRSGGSRGRNQRGNVTDTKKHREAILMDELTGSEPELDNDRMVTLIDVVPPEDIPSLTEEFAQETVRMRVKQRQSTEGKTVSDSLGEPPRNYAFLVTKKLRQRGISLIVGSSSSEDEGEDGEVARVSPRITRRKLDEEFTRFEGEAPEREIRPYSAFVSRKRAGIKLAAGSSNFVPRTSTRDELLRDYSSPSQKSPALRGNTCTTLGKLGDWSSPENAPPINQRRTLQMIKTSSEGFGFTLQTYGIVQQEGQVEYMTFVLNVEEDGPAYMAGLRPGDVILEVDGKNVEEVDHKEVVTLIHQTTESVRLVVVFVDALRRMKLNTRLKILSVELGNREVEFGELCKSEKAILTGRGAVTVDLSTLELTHGRERTNSYLYTTELTSSFAKESPEVHDSLLQYRQTTHDRPRPCSMPDQSELSRQSGKSSIIATTGSEMLKNFASSDLNNQRRTLSSKLMKTFSKKRKSVESFKSYVELDSGDQGAGDEKADEAGSDTSSLSSTSGVCEWPVTSAEPTVAVSTTLERKTEASEAALPQAPPAICTIVERKTEASAAALSQAPPANVPVSCNLSDNGSRGSEETRNSSPILRRVRDDSDVSNGSRIMPGIAQMHRRFEKSATANNSTSTTSRPMPAKEKPKNGSLPTQALKGPQLQRARMSPRPESYLLAMDAAGQEPLIPNEGKNNSAETIMSESGT